MIQLTVLTPFGGRQAGDAITDPADVRRVLAGENAASVVKTDAPQPAKTDKE